MARYLSVLVAALAVTSSLVAEEVPLDLQQLISQRKAAIEKINRTFLGELEKLQRGYMKSGNLEAANRVQKEIDRLRPEARPVDKDEMVREEIAGTSWKNSKGWVITFRSDGRISKSWGKLTPAWSVRNGRIYCEGSEFSFSNDRLTLRGRGGDKGGEWVKME
jgi:hypothetical protein